MGVGGGAAGGAETMLSWAGNRNLFKVSTISFEGKIFNKIN